MAIRRAGAWRSMGRLFLVVLAALWGCGGGDDAGTDANAGSASGAVVAATDRYAYVWAAGVELKVSPDVAAAKVADVAQAARVYLRNGESDAQVTFALGSEIVRSSWRRVALPAGGEGWVPDLALRWIEVKETDEAPRISFDIAAVVGDDALVGGFGSLSMSVGAGGPIRTIAGQCAGYFPQAVTHEFFLVSPAPVLRVFLESGDDTTLAVQLPSGSILCGDDQVGMNPRVDITNPVMGRYRIWAGLFNRGATRPAQLTLSEPS